MNVLYVIQGPDRGRTFSLPDDEPQLIGRSSEALPITDNTVSRRHAELTPDDGSWFLRDLDSQNATYVNGRRLSDRVALVCGDEIRCGASLYRFIDDSGEIDESAFDLDDLDLPAPSIDLNAMTLAASPESLDAARDHLRVLYELTHLTASTIEREDLLQRIVELVMRDFHPDRVMLLLRGTDSDAVAPVVTRTAATAEGLFEPGYSHTIVDRAMAQRRGILARDAEHDRRFEASDSVQGLQLRSVICVPLAASGRVLGALLVESLRPDFTFTESQLHLLTAIGRHAGLALLNAALVRSRMQQERLATMGQTVASVSHSIKNILQGLRGGASAIELALNRDDLQLAREGWPILSRNLDRIYGLTINMLAYSRASQPEIEYAAVEPLIQDAVELVQPQCERKRVHVELHADDAAPPIPIDTAAIHQAIMNLLVNAIDAVPSKGGCITLRTQYALDSDTMRIIVTDNGPGIPAERHEQVFHAFTSSKGQRGTGLGLAVTRKIVHEHNGTIEIDSAPGGGAMFVIELPTDRSDDDSGSTSLPKPMAPPDLDDIFGA